jgi:hypothetical protein
LGGSKFTGNPSVAREKAWFTTFSAETGLAWNSRLARLTFNLEIGEALSGLNYLIWLVKLPLKLSHQMAAIVLNWRLVRAFELSFVTESWTLGNMLREIPATRFFGLRIAELRVPLERIFVTNDHPRHIPGNLGVSYIPIQLSQRFRRVQELRSISSNQESNPTSLVDVQQLTPTDKKILYLSKVSESFSCFVMIRLNGDVVMVDGTHRLFATILRDESVDNISFWLTV